MRYCSYYQEITMIKLPLAGELRERKIGVCKRGIVMKVYRVVTDRPSNS